MKNKRIRQAMLSAGISTQSELAKILGVAESEISSIMKYDLAKAEQDIIIDKIKKAE